MPWDNFFSWFNEERIKTSISGSVSWDFRPPFFSWFEPISAVWCTPRSQNRNLCESLVAFKGTIRRNPFRGEHIYHERKKMEEHIFDLLSPNFWLRCVMHTAMSNFPNFVIVYLGEIDTELENTLACLSGAQIGSNCEKNGGWKSRDILPLNCTYQWFTNLQKVK